MITVKLLATRNVAYDYRQIASYQKCDAMGIVGHSPLLHTSRL